MKDFDPEVLTALSVEDIQELIENAREEFHALNDSDSLEDETLDRMTELADAIDSLHDEYVAKVEFAISKRDEISARVFGTKKDTPAPADEGSKEEEGTESPAEEDDEDKKKPFPGAAKPFGASAETEELATEELSTETVVLAITKSEADGDYPSSDYAYVPDSKHPSEWKLRLTSSPGGDPDPSIVGAAVAALGKGFRGNKVQIPAEDLGKVKAKVRAAWLNANSDRTEADLPSILK